MEVMKGKKKQKPVERSTVEVKALKPEQLTVEQWRSALDDLVTAGKLKQYAVSFASPGFGPPQFMVDVVRYDEAGGDQI